jgi:hypothetical protein
MFSFHRDKVGFVITIILLTIVGGTLISTLVLWIVGLAQGDWTSHLVSMKWILGSAWVACIITVLVRLKIFKWQYERTLRQQEPSESEGQQTRLTSGTSEPSSSLDGGQTS